MQLRLNAIILAFAIICGSACDWARADDAAGIEYFEKHVRPLLVEQCYKCHSQKAEKLKAGLFVDSREGILKGGESGPSAVAGDPEKSLLIKAVRGGDELQMPPKKKLSAEQVRHLEEWVRMGLPFPKGQSGPVVESHLDIEKMRSFWSFQPPRERARPAVKNVSWAKNAIDHFVLAKLEANGLRPARPADKRTLIRRATFDLTGLPPTAEDVDGFLADASANAFEKVIDRLLASPHYGERWGRMWLDIARYADTKGYVFEEERRYPYAYTYRDWVVRALNEDLPYDKFLLYQIAADQIVKKDSRDALEDAWGSAKAEALNGSAASSRHLAAMGFLTLGRRFLNNQSDIIDDRLDVLMRGTQAMTVTCARCHDHKFEPIPTKDYYSLYGVFASSNEPGDLPQIPGYERTPETEAFEAALKDRREDVQKFMRELHAKIVKNAREAGTISAYLLAVHEGKNDGEKLSSLAQNRNLRRPLLNRWKDYLEQRGKKHDSIFGPYFAFAALPEAEFAAKASEIIAAAVSKTDPEKKINPLIAKALADKQPKSMKEVTDVYGAILASMDKTEARPTLDEEQLRLVLHGTDAPTNIGFDEVDSFFNRDDRTKIREQRRKVDELQVTHPGAPPRAMVLADNQNPSDSAVFIRGNAGNHGPRAPRQFLAILSPTDRQPFKQGSGRLELAQAIASKDNPLTARVMANRIWLGHFGQGLVRTPSDFGTRGDLPTHPELLDHLAVHFMKNGWSIKKLHKYMMLSATYQQSSEENPKAGMVDPTNKLLWKMNRRRMDFEGMRDSVLAATGQLDRKIGGKPVDIAGAAARRRTIYGFIDRQNLPNMFRAFDFASPDTHSPQRYTTTVPQQALFMLNNPFILEQSRQLAKRAEAGKTPGEKVRLIYRGVLARDPSSEELGLALEFVTGNSTQVRPREIAKPTWQYGVGHYDLNGKSLKSFTPLPHFTGDAYRGGKELPDAKFGWAILNAEGGHAGNDLEHAVVRRWIAQRDGVLSIRGKLTHSSDSGDGVRAHLIHNGTDELATWTAQKREIETILKDIIVKAGDTIDLVVDCRENVNSDSFTWPVTLRLSSSTPGKSEWRSRGEFAGPPAPPPAPLNAWEKYAQVLLLSNEFVFVD